MLIFTHKFTKRLGANEMLIGKNPTKYIGKRKQKCWVATWCINRPQQQWRSCCKTVHLFHYTNLRQRSTRRSLGLVRTFCYNPKHTIKIPRETVSVPACPCPVFCSVLVLSSGSENLLSWSQGRCKQFKIPFACFFFTVCYAREQWFTAGRLQQTSLILLIL